jgi:hypothetical protein
MVEMEQPDLAVDGRAVVVVSRWLALAGVASCQPSGLAIASLPV